jgi:hypothetical protein
MLRSDETTETLGTVGRITVTSPKSSRHSKAPAWLPLRV